MTAMAFFRRRKDPLEAHAQELAGKIKRLERELREAGQAPVVGNARLPRPVHVPAPEAASSPSSDRPHVGRTRGPAESVPRMPAPAVPRKRDTFRVLVAPRASGALRASAAREMAARSLRRTTKSGLRPPALFQTNRKPWLIVEG